MIEGCKHSPENVIPQPCAECERERVSRERATHAFAAKLSVLAQLGEDALQDAPANPMSLMPAVGDMGAEIAHWKARAEIAEREVARLTQARDTVPEACTSGHVWSSNDCAYRDDEWDWRCDCGQLARDFPPDEVARNVAAEGGPGAEIATEESEDARVSTAGGEVDGARQKKKEICRAAVRSRLFGAREDRANRLWR